MMQSVHLARRVLALERANVSQRRQMESLDARAKTLTDELTSANKLIEDSQQPYAYIIQTVKIKDDEVIDECDRSRVDASLALKTFFFCLWSFFPSYPSYPIIFFLLCLLPFSSFSPLSPQFYHCPLFHLPLTPDKKSTGTRRDPIARRGPSDQGARSSAKNPSGNVR